MEKLFSKIAIVGAGAIGCYYGARLARAGGDVRFLIRSDLARVRERGLRVKTPDEEIVLPGVHAAGTPEEIGPCDLVLVALKTTANAALGRLLGPLVHGRTTIVTLQNGLGSDEELARLFGAERVAGGLCFIGVNRVAPGEIVCLTPGSVSFGEFQRPAGGRVRALADMFSRAGVRTIVSDNLAELRWKKLVWNVPFNGLAIAAGGVTTDVLTGDEELLAAARALMLEIVAAARAVTGCEIPPQFVEKQIEVTKAMGPYKPSSLIDFLEGREVEVESIWGEPLRRARAAGVDAPRLAMLYALVRRLAAR
ncbi:2-dehydropantoate 2-reductase [Termitidicoccus mucosus]|uniref:2-dehydropantoate 2-reductase n=1 Tax=Termitidicoccus mucosus TaxID=1184151 RepID=A0A178IFG3_9BACT|nr:2-dehydropantoate 2-reductase [Opitutaceae bacterium TSB47]